MGHAGSNRLNRIPLRRRAGGRHAQRHLRRRYRFRSPRSTVQARLRCVGASFQRWQMRPCRTVLVRHHGRSEFCAGRQARPPGTVWPMHCGRRRLHHRQWHCLGPRQSHHVSCRYASAAEWQRVCHLRHWQHRHSRRRVWLMAQHHLTIDALADRLTQIPRFPLAHLPTPLEFCPRFSKALGDINVLVKRDDLTGLAFGGNKTRQLEFIFGEVLRSGADIVVAGAYTQSNWCRQITAAARKFGLDVSLVLAHGVKGPMLQGNLLLDRIMGAEVTILNVLDEELQPYLEAKANELRAQGRKAFLISSFELGAQSLAALGYVEAVVEIVRQLAVMGRTLDHIYVAGSEISPAGLNVGVRALGLPTRVASISPIA